MGEVEEFGGGIDKGEAEGDKCIDGARDYGVDEELVKHNHAYPRTKRLDISNANLVDRYYNEFSIKQSAVISKDFDQ